MESLVAALAAAITGIVPTTNDQRQLDKYLCAESAALRKLAPNLAREWEYCWCIDTDGRGSPDGDYYWNRSGTLAKTLVIDAAAKSDEDVNLLKVRAVMLAYASYRRDALPEIMQQTTRAVRYIPFIVGGPTQHEKEANEMHRLRESIISAIRPFYRRWIRCASLQSSTSVVTKLRAGVPGTLQECVAAITAMDAETYAKRFIDEHGSANAVEWAEAASHAQLADLTTLREELDQKRADETNAWSAVEAHREIEQALREQLAAAERASSALAHNLKRAYQEEKEWATKVDDETLRQLAEREAVRVLPRAIEHADKKQKTR